MGRGTTYKYFDCTTLSDKKDQPQDTVQMIKWYPFQNETQMFATVGWDGKLRVYEATTKNTSSYSSSKKLVLECRGTLDIGVPLTAVEWITQESLLVATIKCDILEVDLKSGKANKIAQSQFIVFEIKCYQDNSNLILFVFQLNETLCVHLPKSNNQFPSKVVNFKYKMVACDMIDDMIAIAFEESRFLVVKLKDLDSAQELSYESLTLKDVGKTKISSISLNFYLDSLIVGTACGRVEEFSLTPSQYSRKGFQAKSKFTHKGHVSKISSTRSELFPLTAIEHIPNKKNAVCYATSFANGLLKIWSKKETEPLVNVELSSSSNHPNKDVSTIRFNNSGSLLAIAIGYSWNKGIWGLQNVNYQPEILLLPIDDSKLY